MRSDGIGAGNGEEGVGRVRRALGGRRARAGCRMALGGPGWRQGVSGSGDGAGRTRRASGAS
jgi:hypothetical protein